MLLYPGHSCPQASQICCDSPRLVNVEFFLNFFLKISETLKAPPTKGLRSFMGYDDDLDRSRFALVYSVHFQRLENLRFH